MAISKIENSSLASGVPGTANLPAGTVLQVVQGVSTTYVVTTSSTYSTTGLTATITPTSATSKILVCIQLANAGKAAGSTAAYAKFQLYKNGASLVSLSDVFGYTNVSMEVVAGAAFSYLDSPATTAATTYSVYFASNGSQAAFLNTYFGSNGASLSSITLMEIAA